MNKAQMMSILGAVEDSKLIQAMKSIGIDTGEDEMDFGDEQAEGLEDWNKRDVYLIDTPREPFVDMAKFTKSAAEKPAKTQKKPYFNPDDSENSHMDLQMGDDGRPLI